MYVLDSGGTFPSEATACADSHSFDSHSYQYYIQSGRRSAVVLLHSNNMCLRSGPLLRKTADKMAGNGYSTCI